LAGEEGFEPNTPALFAAVIPTMESSKTTHNYLIYIFAHLCYSIIYVCRYFSG